LSQSDDDFLAAGFAHNTNISPPSPSKSPNIIPFNAMPFIIQQGLLRLCQHCFMGF